MSSTDVIGKDAVYGVDTKSTRYLNISFEYLEEILQISFGTSSYDYIFSEKKNSLAENHKCFK